MKNYRIKNAVVFKGEIDFPRKQLTGTLNEIIAKMNLLKISHISRYWTKMDFFPTTMISESFLDEYNGHEDRILFMFNDSMDEIHFQLKRLGISGITHPLWPVEDRLCIIRIDIFEINYWIGWDPCTGAIKIPVDDNKFIEQFINCLANLPDKLGAKKTFNEIEKFFKNWSLATLSE